jgi:ATP-dependent DNA helicase Rep
MEENLLPHRVSVEEDNIEEERRLAYVGITRARETLTMTHALKRRQYGEMVSCEPSRFLSELPPDDLMWEGGDAQTEADRLQHASATLSSLKSLFA